MPYQNIYLTRRTEQARLVTLFALILMPLFTCAATLTAAEPTTEIEKSVSLWNQANDLTVINSPKQLGKIAERLKNGGKIAGLVEAFITAKLDELAIAPNDPAARIKTKLISAQRICKYLDANFVELTTGLQDNITLICESTTWMALSGRVDAACAIVDEIGKRTNGLDLVPLAMQMSLLQAAKSDWPEAIRMAVQAVDLSNGVYASGAEDTIGKLRVQASENHKRIVRLRDISIHGLGFRLFYEANIQRMQLNNFQEAQKIYQQLLDLSKTNKAADLTIAAIWLNNDDLLHLPIHPIYVAAARHGILACLYGQQSLDFFKTPYSEYIQEIDSPFFPANALIAADAYLVLGNVDAASNLLTSASKWIKSPRVNPMYEIPKQSIERVKPPDSMRGPSGMAQVSWFNPRPNELYTVANSSWWSKYIDLQCNVRLALIQYLQGNREAALKSLDYAMSLDDQDVQYTKKGIPSNFLRLRDGIVAGEFYGTKAELACFPKELTPALLLAEWKFECEEWASAVVDYNRIAGLKGLSVNAKAYLDYVRSCAFIYMEQNSKANDLLIAFSDPKSKYRNSPSYSRAIFTYGSIKESPEDSVSIWSKALADDIDNNSKADFCMAIGQTYMGMKKWKDAIQYFSFVEKYAPQRHYRNSSGFDPFKVKHTIGHGQHQDLHRPASPAASLVHQSHRPGRESRGSTRLHLASS